MASIALIQAQSGGAPWLQFVPIVVMVIIFYVLVFVPQARQRKVHKAMIDSLAKGDQVVTMGGLIGEVVQVKDDVVTVRTGQAVVAVERARIARRTSGAVKAKQG
ncbi:MAG TPA: preprotein translocase subunit YajC [Longimicrobiaceae bacterium]|nr:preprotein translocase subunit YajC [Longimicrobiaceae bacterium]